MLLPRTDITFVFDHLFTVIQLLAFDHTHKTSTSSLLRLCLMTADSLPLLAKTVPRKASQTNDRLTNSAKSPPTNVNTDRKDQSEKPLRRSSRLQGIPVSDFNLTLPATIQEMPNSTMLCAPALLPAGTVPNGTLASTNSDSSARIETTNNDITLTDSGLKQAQSPSADPKVSVRDASQPDIGNSSECEEADNENNDDPEIAQDNDEDDNESNKPLPPKQKRGKGTSAKLSRKRKADTSGGQKAAGSGLDPPAKKKQKVNKPTTKRQSKAGNPKPKTAKERFQAASAEDTRPLPWGQPEVWADVCSFCGMNVNNQR